MERSVVPPASHSQLHPTAAEHQAEAFAVWAQCDACAKWRELPRGVTLLEQRAWTCADHPERRWRSCEV